MRFRVATQLLDLVVARLVNEKFLVVLDVEEAGDEVSEAHRA